ncbi:Exostosin, GT47 domain [Dillenia turbinata]|uniref:Exostosin, GT47 domain n=1 Tax=Dillenia turbinata TaxID=194707 RepID=A0AAN8V0J0_9MAGN
MERRKQPGDEFRNSENETSKTRKNSDNNLQQIHQPRTCLYATILFIQLSFFLFLARSLFHSSLNVINQYIIFGNPNCGSGMFYVYDLPPSFNKELIQSCHDINPWRSLCDAVSNGGLGPLTTGLDEVVPENLTGAWHTTEQYASEIIFHNRAMSHPCRTLHPESALAFYIPFYARFALERHLWARSSSSDRDRLFGMMLEWIKRKGFWNKSSGLDHFMMIGRVTWDYRRARDEDWGSSFFLMPEMKNVMRLIGERNPWDASEVGVPYPTGFHPRSVSDVVRWQDHVRSHRRTTLFCFVGGTREKFKNDFRGLLISLCKNESDSCRVVDCAGHRCTNGTSTILNTFLHSDFCLQPRGDSLTRRSVFDCMVAGSIPVFFWTRTAYDQYLWHLPPDPASYSVFIDKFKVMRNGTPVKQVLESYSKADIERMREKVIEYIPKLVYAKLNEGLGTMKDAFDVTIDEVMRTIKELRYKQVRVQD